MFILRLRYAVKGMLSAIEYPAGGASIFEYEPNDYSAVLIRDTEGYPVPVKCPITQGGGVRIKSISEVTTLDTNHILYDTLSHRRFEYRHNDRSSGISYMMARSVAGQIAGAYNDTCILEMPSPDKFYGASLIGGGTDELLEYSHVTETRLDGSSTKYQYTSYWDTPDPVEGKTRGLLYIICLRLKL